MSHARPALDILAELRRGALSRELTDALHDVITACRDSGKPGEVVLKLKITPQKTHDYETPQIEVADVINSRTPKRSVMPSRFFLTDDGAPVRRDPNQDAFEPLRDVSEPHTPIDATDRKQA